MNILFLTIGGFESIEAHSIYTDLLRCFRDNGHEVYTITPYEKRTGKKTELIHEKGSHILCIETGDVTGSNNLISKGFAQLSVESIYIRAIKKYFSTVKFDLVMYSTPPITFGKAIEFVKKRDGAKSYLLLKDIFPQNAVDLGMITKSDIKGLIYKYFRSKEKKLYSLSDRIGCMSPANVQYVLEHNPEIDKNIVEVCPNCVDVVDKSVDEKTRINIREKYCIPLDKKVFVYGGNLGRPQGILFIIECLRKCQDIKNAYFLIVGDGTEYEKLKNFVNVEKPSNVKLMKRLPKEDYDTMVGACDVGLIFLDYRFTIPNFPSRLLSYMQAKIPVLCATDKNTDIGSIALKNGFGWWCESNDSILFCKYVSIILSLNTKSFGENGYIFLTNHYTVKNSYQVIMQKI